MAPGPARPGGGRPLAGRGGSSALWRVTLPLIAPGLAAAFCLVFMSAATELTATLLLHPPASTRSPPSSGPYTAELPTARRRRTRSSMIGDLGRPAYLLSRRIEHALPRMEAGDVSRCR